MKTQTMAHPGVTATEMKRAFSVFLLLACVSFASNSWAGSGLRVIDTARLHSMVMDNTYALEGGRKAPFTVIDARGKEEYDESHIASAINIPEKDLDELTHLLPKDKGTLMVVYCNEAKPETSGKWADKAETAGYKNIVIYAEGFRAWKKQQMPVAPLR